MLSVFIYVVKWMLNQFLGVQVQEPKLAIKKHANQDADIEHGTQIHKNCSASAGNVELPISFLITQKIVKEESFLQKSNDAHFDDEIKNISDLDDDSGEIESTTESEESTYPKNCSGTPTTSSNFGSDQWSLDSNEKKIEGDNEDYDSGLHESDTPSESNDIIKEDSDEIEPCMKNFGQSRYQDPEFLRAVNAVNYPFLLDSYFEWKDNARELKRSQSTMEILKDYHSTSFKGSSLNLKSSKRKFVKLFKLKNKMKVDE